MKERVHLMHSGQRPIIAVNKQLVGITVTTLVGAGTVKPFIIGNIDRPRARMALCL